MSQALAEFRAKYPQYDDMPDRALADALHAKFYRDVPVEDFYQQVGLVETDPTVDKVPTPSGLFPLFSSLTARASNAVGFGGMDEAGAALAAPVTAGIDQIIGLVNKDFKPRSIGEAYEQGLAGNRQRLKYAEQEAPAASLGADILGGLASPGIQKMAETVRAAPSMLRKVAGGVTDAAATGAASGFLSAEGGPGNRAEGALAGGLTGAAIGAIVPAGIGLAAPTIKSVRNLLGMQNPEREAVEMVLRALERDGMTPEQAADFLRQAKSLQPGSEMALVDSGRNTQRLGRMAETVPSQGSREMTDFLLARQQGQGDRATTLVEDTLGADNWRRTREGLDKKRKTEAAPLYDKSNAKEGVWSPEIEKLMRRPSVRAAADKALKIAAEEGVDPTSLGIDFNDAGDVVFRRVPSMRTLDYVKRGLDDVLEGYRDKTSGKLALDDQGRATDQTRRALLAELKTLNSDYAAALSTYAGPSRSIGALESGRAFARGDVEGMEIKFRELEPGDKDFFKIGVVDEIKRRIDAGSDSREVMNRVFGPRHVRNRLRVLFDSPDEFENFVKAIENEALTTRTKNIVTGGSPTARIAAEQDDAATSIPGLLVDTAAQGLRPTLMNLASRSVNRVRGVNEPTSDALAKLLREQDPENVAIMERFRQGQISRQDMNRLVNRYLLLTGSVTGGGQVGSAATAD